jgi:hypothetical protein
MTKLHITMLVTILTNADCLPRTLDWLEIEYWLEEAKSGNIEVLNRLNSMVISRRGRLLRK